MFTLRGRAVFLRQNSREKSKFQNKANLKRISQSGQTTHYEDLQPGIVSKLHFVLKTAYPLYEITANAFQLLRQFGSALSPHRFPYVIEANLICSSFLIVTEKDLQSCSWLVTFLSRLSNPAHRQLKLLSEKAVEVEIFFLY